MADGFEGGTIQNAACKNGKCRQNDHLKIGARLLFPVAYFLFIYLFICLFIYLFNQALKTTTSW